MHTIETTAIVSPSHELVVRSQVPEEVVPGEHIVQVTIGATVESKNNDRPFFRSSYPIGLTSDAATFRREDIYDDAGR